MENSNRPRRMRKDEFSRRLMREHHLRTDDLIYPVFVMEGHQKEEAIPSMPGIKRQSADLIIDTAKECFKLCIPAIALFPVIDVNLKTEDAKEALRIRLGLFEFSIIFKIEINFLKSGLDQILA